VLGGVDLDLRPGQVLALTGENGAGKSTLSKIICGLVDASAGGMTLDGQALCTGLAHPGGGLGIRMVMQELNLIPTLSIAENLFLEKLPQPLRLDRPQEAGRGRPRPDGSGRPRRLDPWTPVGELGIGHQQMVEIARNLIGAAAA
jgi:ribose transport system ATP-binding protein